MPVFDLSSIAESAFSYARKALYALALVSFFTLVIAMMATFVTSFFYFYDLINMFINHLNGSGSGELVDKMFGLMTCIGFTSAFNDTKSILISAVIFLLARIISAQVIHAYYTLLRVIAPLTAK